MFAEGSSSRGPLGAVAAAVGFQSDEEDTLEGFNGMTAMDLDEMLTNQGRGMGDREDGPEGMADREKLVDADFFNAFDDDFDEDDIKPRD